MMSQSHSIAPVRDIMNESFHEHRPSFRTLVSKFDKKKPSGTTSYNGGAKKCNIEKLIKEKTIRKQFNESFANTSFGSLGSLDKIGEEAGEAPPDVIVEGDEEGFENEMEDDAVEEMAEILAELVFEPDDIESEVPEQAPEQAPEPVAKEPAPKQEKKKKKKRTPVFNTEPFVNNYELGEELGSGAYAVVKEGTHRQTKKSYAIKIVEIESMDQEDLDALQIEISVMAKLKHPNIIRLYETYCEEQYYYLVTEKMIGGELLDRVVQKTYYNEKEARDTCLVLFEAMRYCHSKKIAHRDLKPENLLLLSNDSDSNIKIADFGFAKKCPSEGLTTMCGTPGYVAPEVLEREAYSTQCDMWSLGVIVYILLGGYSPFEENDQDVLFSKIRAGDYTFHEEFWGPVSNDAKDLIRSLLTVNPRRRLTAEKALKHKWMTVSDDILASMDLGANLTELKKFNAKRKFKAAVKTVIATQKLTSLFI